MRARSLIVPAARQGPGPLPASSIEALRPRVDRLVSRATPGDQRAAGVGAGLELAQIRPYEIGDDVRQLDAPATARSGGQPHVRLQVPERSLTTWIVLDVSPSMAFGTSRRLKADVAEGVALAFGRLAVRRAGSVGLVRFGAGRTLAQPPRGSRPGLIALRRALSEGVAPDGVADPGALADALRRTGRLARQPGLVVVISDFRAARDWEGPLGSLRLRHSLLAVEISDPREMEILDVGRIALIDPETGERTQIDTSRARVRDRFAELERARQVGVAGELRRLRAPHVTLSTDGEWLRELGRRLPALSGSPA